MRRRCLLLVLMEGCILSANFVRRRRLRQNPCQPAWQQRRGLTRGRMRVALPLRCWNMRAVRPDRVVALRAPRSSRVSRCGPARSDALPHPVDPTRRLAVSRVRLAHPRPPRALPDASAEHRRGRPTLMRGLPAFRASCPDAHRRTLDVRLAPRRGASPRRCVRHRRASLALVHAHLQLHGRAILRRHHPRHPPAVLPSGVRHRQQQPVDPQQQVQLSPDPVRLALQVRRRALHHVRPRRHRLRHPVRQRLTQRFSLRGHARGGSVDEGQTPAEATREPGRVSLGNSTIPRAGPDLRR